MHIGIGTIYLMLILAKVLGFISMGWFWVITSIIWLPIIVVGAYLAAATVFTGIVAGIIWLLER